MKGAHNANRSVWQERFWITMPSSSAPASLHPAFFMPRHFPAISPATAVGVPQDVASPAATGKVRARFFGALQAKVERKLWAMRDVGPTPASHSGNCGYCFKGHHSAGVSTPARKLDHLAVTWAAARRAPQYIS